MDNVKEIDDLIQRRQRNQELIRRMRAGDPLKSFDAQASWFPPRPVIKKDKKLMGELYAITKKSTNVKDLHLKVVDEQDAEIVDLPTSA